MRWREDRLLLPRSVRRPRDRYWRGLPTSSVLPCFLTSFAYHLCCKSLPVSICGRILVFCRVQIRGRKLARTRGRPRGRDGGRDWRTWHDYLRANIANNGIDVDRVSCAHANQDARTRQHRCPGVNSGVVGRRTCDGRVGTRHRARGALRCMRRICKHRTAWSTRREHRTAGTCRHRTAIAVSAVQRDRDCVLACHVRAGSPVRCRAVTV